MSTPIICIIVAVVCFVLYSLVSKGEKKLQAKAAAQQQAATESQFTPEQLKFLNTVDSLFKNNEVKEMREVLEECGMPHDVAFGKDNALREEHIPFVKGEHQHNVFTTYAMTIDKRFHLQNEPLFTISSDNFGLNLHKDEGIYHAIYGVTLLQEKTTVTNVMYNGLVWKNGPLRTGNLSVMTNEITHFSPVDAGKIYFTNERIIFIGKQKNVTKHIKYDDIISCNVYQDGIMVNIPNRKPILFKFQKIADYEIYELSDPINQFIIVSNRMMAGNYDKTLVQAQRAVDAEANKSIESALIEKNYAPMLVKILEMAKVGEPVSTSAIQRKFEIGYMKAGKYVDQLEALFLVTPSEGGRREWLVDYNDTDTILKLIEAANSYPVEMTE